MDHPSLLTPAEFAFKIGRSERQVRRYIGQGRLPAVSTPEGLRVSPNELEAWGPIRKPGHPVALSGKTTGQDVYLIVDARQNDGGMSDGGDTMSPPRANVRRAGVGKAASADTMAITESPLTAPSVPLPAHLRTLDLLEAAYAAADRERDGREREREEKERVREERDRANRRAEHLASELQSYQRALGEQAESLAEERARRLALELAAANRESEDPPAQQLVIVEHPPAVVVPTDGTTRTIDQLPAPATKMTAANQNKGGWGRRFKRWFLGERTG